MILILQPLKKVYIGDLNVIIVKKITHHLLEDVGMRKKYIKNKNQTI